MSIFFPRALRIVVVGTFVGISCTFHIDWGVPYSVCYVRKKKEAEEWILSKKKEKVPNWLVLFFDCRFLLLNEWQRCALILFVVHCVLAWRQAINLPDQSSHPKTDRSSDKESGQDEKRGRIIDNGWIALFFLSLRLIQSCFIIQEKKIYIESQKPVN